MYQSIDQKRRRSLAAMLAVAASFPLMVGAMSSQTLAQEDFPTKPVNMIVPFVAGGAGSTLVRIIEPIMSKELGQPLVIENKGGASGAIGAKAALEAPADGYTVFTPSNTIISDAVLRPDIGYDYRNDFVAVSKLAYSPHYLIVRSDLGIETLDQLIAYAKQNPGKLKYAHSGVGGAVHLTGEMFNHTADVDIKAVPYKGTADQLTAILNKSVEVTWDFVANWKERAANGEVKILAVGGAERDPSLPEVPTVAETFAGFEGGAWVGIFARKGTPDVAIQRISAAAQKATADPENIEKLKNIGYAPVGNDSETFNASLEVDLKKYTEVVKAAGLLPK